MEVVLPHQFVIDGLPIIDKKTNELYLFYAAFSVKKYISGPLNLYAIKMTNVNTADFTSNTLILEPENTWEFISATPFSPQGIIEGPSLLQLNDGRYLLFYSGASADTNYYNMGTAIASDILGPYERLNKSHGIFNLSKYPSTGHGSVITDKGQTYLICHTNLEKNNKSWYRSPIIFKLDVNSIIN